MRIFLVCALAAIAGLHGAAVSAQQLRAYPNLALSGVGRVESMVVQGDGKIIIGGAFYYVTAIGDVRVNIARLNADGSLDTTFNFRPTSTVDALAIIGSTLYLGGDFTGLSKVGGASTLRNRLAAIDLGTLTITSWNPNVDDEVFALAASGTTLYAGGRFAFVGGVQRIGGAAFDTAAAGALTAWDPETRDANAVAPVYQGLIYAIAPFGGTIYIGGTFTQAGGLGAPNPAPQARQNVAAVDPVNGFVTTWDPWVSNGAGTSVVRAIVPTASVVYLGGQFSALNNPGYTRVGIGAVNATTGSLIAWNPGHTPLNGGGTVRALALDGATMYVGGEITGIGGAIRAHAAGVDTAAPAITSLTRAAGIATATVASTAALVTGGFVTIAGATQTAYNGVYQITVVDGTRFSYNVAGSPVSPATGTLSYAKNDNATAFNPNLDDAVHAMAVSGTDVLLGGTFLKANNVPNPAFGGFAKASGARTIDGYVYDTATARSLVRQSDGKTVVAGDFFLDTGGEFYRGLLRLNADDTLDTDWNPGVDGAVTTASLGPALDNTVLIGGTFTKVGSAARSNLAAVSLGNGLATAFDANVNGPVNKALVDGSSAYVGGLFTQVGGVDRFFVAAVNPTTGALQSWYPTDGTPAGSGADGPVEVLAVDASNVYLGGGFFTAGGQSRRNLAKVSKASSVVDGIWNPGADDKVYGLTVIGSTVYASGNFHVLSGQTRNFTGAVDSTSGAATAWNPNPDFVVVNVTPAVIPANTLYLSGAFLNVNGTHTGTAAAVDNATGLVKPWFPLLNDTVYDLIPDTTRVLLGGLFVTSGLTPRLSLAGFTIASVPDPPTGAAAAGGNALANVSFTPPGNNGGSVITGYTATCTPTAGAPVTASGPSSPVNVPGLANGVTYTCTAHGTNAVGDGGESLPTNSVTPSAVPTPTLTVSLAGSGTGSVASNPAGIACPGVCGQTYPGTTGVVLTATASIDSIFTGWLGACTDRGTCNLTVAGPTSVSATFAPSAVLPLRVNVDGNSVYDALTDGLIVIRYLSGVTGSALTAGALGGGATLTDPTLMLNHLNDIRPIFDIDGNGQVDAATDGLLLTRYLFGLRGSSLIAGAVGTGATRTTPAQIEPYIQSLMP